MKNKYKRRAFDKHLQHLHIYDIVIEMGIAPLARLVVDEIGDCIAYMTISPGIMDAMPVCTYREADAVLSL